VENAVLIPERNPREVGGVMAVVTPNRYAILTRGVRKLLKHRDEKGT
jgi:hypothetical protein